jgi:hypothetical protein
VPLGFVCAAVPLLPGNTYRLGKVNNAVKNGENTAVISPYLADLYISKAYP